MSAMTSPLAETTGGWKLPYRGTVGMACLIIAESAIFTIFVVAYLFYLGKSLILDRLHGKCSRLPSSIRSVCFPAV